MENITIPKKEYDDLVQKANGFKLQSEFFTKIRNELNPTEKQKTLPWYEMLYQCIVNINSIDKQ